MRLIPISSTNQSGISLSVSMSERVLLLEGRDVARLTCLILDVLHARPEHR